MVKNPKIDYDTFIEGFSGLYCRVIVTADDVETLCKAASDSTATPSVVIGRTEGGVERYLSEDETPDGRVGGTLQFWANPQKGLRFTPREIREELPCSPHTPRHPR